VELLEREPLLAHLRALHAGVVETGGAMVFVSGEAGIGKSALTRGFCDALPVGTAVHRGFCDALGTPRALGPLHDMARTSLAGLGRLLTGGEDRHSVFTAFLDLIGAGPSVTVIEDAHWADEATLDLLLFVGRRVGDLPATVVVTYRTEEVGRDHPLRRVLGDLASERSVHRLSVPALSEVAVVALAEPFGRDGAQLHAVTGGNPFFVTEALGAPAEHIPVTVRDAVLARASRLGVSARAILDVVALVPDRAEVTLLASVLAAETAALDDCIGSGMLVAEGPTVRFRHELARRAVEGDVPAARASQAHARILAHLVATDAVDPTRLSYHADAAGDAAAVLLYAPIAAELASAWARTGRPQRTTTGPCATPRGPRRRGWRSCGSDAPMRASAGAGYAGPCRDAARWTKPSTRRREPSRCGGPPVTSSGRRLSRPAARTCCAMPGATWKRTSRHAPRWLCWSRCRRGPGTHWRMRPWPG
jgi:AAA ATPase domain